MSKSTKGMCSYNTLLVSFDFLMLPVLTNRAVVTSDDMLIGTFMVDLMNRT